MGEKGDFRYVIDQESPSTRCMDRTPNTLAKELGMVDFCRPQGVSAVDQNHLLADAGEDQGIRRRGVSAPRDNHGLVLIEHTVTGCAVADTLANQFPLVRDPQLSGTGPGGQHNSPGV